MAQTIAQKVDPYGTSAEKSIPRFRMCVPQPLRPVGTSYLDRATSIDQPDGRAVLQVRSRGQKPPPNETRVLRDTVDVRRVYRLSVGSDIRLCPKCELPDRLGTDARGTAIVRSLGLDEK